MKLLNYVVRKPDGTKFNTTSYKEAISGGGRIEDTYLTDVDERSEAIKEWSRKHIQKIKEVFKAKRG